MPRPWLKALALQLARGVHRLVRIAQREVAAALVPASTTQ